MDEFRRTMNLNQWVDMFRLVYYPTQNYERSRYQVFARVAKNLAGGSQNILRKRNADAAYEFLGKLFAWYCALVTAVGQDDLEEIVWFKYPAACPRCRENPCSCEGEPGAIDWEALQDLQVDNERLRPKTLREWQTMFAGVYRDPVAGLPRKDDSSVLSALLTRLAEELGEVGEAICLDGRIDPSALFAVRNELADVFAWMMALANNIHLMGSNVAGFMIEDRAWQMYPNKCYHCQESPCQCVRGEYRLQLASFGAAAPSQFDPRTGVANYRGLERMLARADRDVRQTSLGLIFFDLDHFGQINKDYDHDAGDKVLRSTAQAAVDVVGDRGTVFRRGGEEFVVLLPGMTLGQSVIIAEEIRSAFERCEVDVAAERGPIRVTGSFGVSALPEESGTARDLERRAESRASSAKSGGRNRVVAND
jgi:diguanylate cyclase (GGDEF)-like protein